MQARPIFKFEVEINTNGNNDVSDVYEPLVDSLQEKLKLLLNSFELLAKNNLTVGRMTFSNIIKIETGKNLIPNNGIITRSGDTTDRNSSPILIEVDQKRVQNKIDIKCENETLEKKNASTLITSPLNNPKINNINGSDCKDNDVLIKNSEKADEKTALELIQYSSYKSAEMKEEKNDSKNISSNYNRSLFVPYEQEPIRYNPDAKLKEEFRAQADLIKKSGRTEQKITISESPINKVPITTANSNSFSSSNHKNVNTNNAPQTEKHHFNFGQSAISSSTFNSSTISDIIHPRNNVDAAIKRAKAAMSKCLTRATSAGFSRASFNYDSSQANNSQNLTTTFTLNNSMMHVKAQPTVIPTVTTLPSNYSTFKDEQRQQIIAIKQRTFSPQQPSEQHGGVTNRPFDYRSTNSTSISANSKLCDEVSSCVSDEVKLLLKQQIESKSLTSLNLF